MAANIPRINLPPENGPARDAAILTRVRMGDHDPIRWTNITGSKGGHSVTLRMFAWPLMMDGVIVNVSARLQQQIADVLKCSLPTCTMVDLQWLARAVTLLPSAQPITSSTAGMEEHSARVMAALAAAGGWNAVGDRAAATYGKNWCIRKATVTSYPGKFCNYGWNFPGTSYGGASAHCVTPGLYCIQDPGWHHDPTHTDYSQECMLVSLACAADGALADVREVLVSPALAPCVSDEGALPVSALRVPGMPLLPQPTGVSTSAVELPLHPHDPSECPNVDLGELAQIAPWGMPSLGVQEWAGTLLVYPLGTVVRDVVDGEPIVGRLECHPPSTDIPRPHKGVTVYRPTDAAGVPLRAWPAS